MPLAIQCPPTMMTALSASPILDSDLHRAYDLRTRTVTYMLSALEATNSDSTTNLTPNPVLVKHETDLYAARKGSRDDNSTNKVNASMLKFLNQVALLLVREHEIVAVLPKRSGSQAHLNVMVTIDSDSDPDEPSTQENAMQQTDKEKCIQGAVKYLVARNLPNESLGGKRSNASAITAEVLRALEPVTTLKDMYKYLMKYRHVSFSDHVSSIEFLLNRIIAPSPQLRNERRRLFERYITFRAAPKMYRRFKSAGFTSFLQALKSLTAPQIYMSVEFHMRTRGIAPLTIKDEAHEDLVPDILYCGDFESPESKCPYLWKQHENSDDDVADVVYTAESASEFHQLLIYILEKAAETLAEFIDTYKTGDSIAHNDDLLTEVEGRMGYVHLMVHESTIFNVHVEALNSDITGLMRKLPPLSTQPPLLPSLPQAEGTQTKPLDELNDKRNLNSITYPDAQQDEDNDGGLSDTEIEISAAKAVFRACQQSLWLAASFQQAIESVCHELALPKNPISLILFKPPVAKTPSTQMESWKDVVASLFPTRFSISPASSPEPYEACIDSGGRIVMTEASPIVTVEEISETLEAYGKDHGGKATLFLPNGEATTKFRGVYHAESILATMAYLGYSPTNCITSINHTEPPENIHVFRNTYGTIGVSKRCCPICTKLLSLLTPSQTDTTIPPEPLTVLCAHSNIYPTSLPPLLPPDVAEHLVSWLEELLKDELVNLVKKKRRLSAVSAKRTKSQHSEGESRGKENKGRIVPVRPVGKAKAAVKAVGGPKRFAKWNWARQNKEEVSALGHGQQPQDGGVGEALLGGGEQGSKQELGGEGSKRKLNANLDERV
ncbi:hypothetical protein EV426DRAFT_196340 [Tirmania nivea]|nr:hypothetical protein EV426DRAFT_196340 [Tirmania nivea]